MGQSAVGMFQNDMAAPLPHNFETYLVQELDDFPSRNGSQVHMKTLRASIGLEK